MTKLTLTKNLSHDEAATVLAALRLWQMHRFGLVALQPGVIPDSFEHFEDARELKDDEIDGLCEAINLQPEPRKPTDGLPPDPEAMNDSRARWADAAIGTFMEATGADREDALKDLLTDLMHWVDRETGADFEVALDSAHRNYLDETMESVG